MPNIIIECCYCGYEAGVTLFEADDWAESCPECSNDACPNCRDKKHPDHHPQCWQDAQDLEPATPGKDG